MPTQTGRTDFLSDLPLRAVQLDDAVGLRVDGLLLEQGAAALEVLVVQAAERPTETARRSLLNRRNTK